MKTSKKKYKSKKGVFFMKTRKNLFAFIALCIIFSIFASTTVFARSLYIDTTLTTISISSGTATAKGNVTGYSGVTTQLKVYLYLQQYKNGLWQDIANWSDTFNTYKGTLTETSNVTSGYKYRVKAIYYGYGIGGGYDEITTYSNEVTY